MIPVSSNKAGGMEVVSLIPAVENGSVRRIDFSPETESPGFFRALQDAVVEESHRPDPKDVSDRGSLDRRAEDRNMEESRGDGYRTEIEKNPAETGDTRKQAEAGNLADEDSSRPRKATEEKLKETNGQNETRSGKPEEAGRKKIEKEKTGKGERDLEETVNGNGEKGKPDADFLSGAWIHFQKLARLPEEKSSPSGEDALKKNFLERSPFRDKKTGNPEGKAKGTLELFLENDKKNPANPDGKDAARHLFFRDLKETLQEEIRNPAEKAGLHRKESLAEASKKEGFSQSEKGKGTIHVELDPTVWKINGRISDKEKSVSSPSREHSGDGIRLSDELKGNTLQKKGHGKFSGGHEDRQKSSGESGEGNQSADTFLGQTGKNRDFIVTEKSGVRTPSGEKSEIPFRNLVEKAKIDLEANGNSRASIRLRPEALGRMTMDLQVEGNRLQAKLLVDSDEARKHILKELDHLKNELKQHGIQVDSFQVRVKEPAPGGFAQNQSRNDNPLNGNAFASGGEDSGNSGQHSGETDPSRGNTSRRILDEVPAAYEEESYIRSGVGNLSKINIAV